MTQLTTKSKFQCGRKNDLLWPSPMVNSLLWPCCVVLCWALLADSVWAQVAAAPPLLAPERAAQNATLIRSLSSFALKTGVPGVEVKSLRVAEPAVVLPPAAGPKGAKPSGERTQDVQVELSGGYAAQKLWLNEMLARYPSIGLLQWDMQRQDAGTLQGRLTLRLRLEPQQ